MNRRYVWWLAPALALLSATSALAAVNVASERNTDNASEEFKFVRIPAPSPTDSGGRARFEIVAGRADGNSAGLNVLNDGEVPEGDDEPGANFFFDTGTDGGRLLADLGRVVEIKQVNTYSWHPGSRGPQKYKLYASEGSGDRFKLQPESGVHPQDAGWEFLAAVDTRLKAWEPGGQYGVSVFEPEGVLGRFRYFLFDISRTEAEDEFGNTFFSEIDIVAPGDPPPTGVGRPGAGRYEIAIDAEETPELQGWIDSKLRPVVEAWYPRIVETLPSEGFVAPRQLSIKFVRDMDGVAHTAGTRIFCAARWFKRNLDGEAAGAVVHELVHVAQQYRSRRNPSWLVEGVADYIRWFKYEPASLRPRPDPARARYTDSYRTTAAFLEYVTAHHDHEFVVRMNAAMRQGRYSNELWKEYTGKSVDELWTLYVASLEGEPAPVAAAEPADASGHNRLTPEERKAGWILLFDGKTFNGWHNFKAEGVREGWQVQDGTLACVDPRHAGDIATVERFDWFELSIEYNISEGGNSGIMYHVTDEEGAVWETGPEIQLQDNEHAHDTQMCGWLYALYAPPDDPKTGKPIDATKSAGEWNHIRVIIAPRKCEHYVNGVKYVEYVLGSDDFKARVAKSKFGGMPRFAKADSGFLALQGDHGRVSFRNIKLRPIEPGR